MGAARRHRRPQPDLQARVRAGLITTSPVSKLEADERPRVTRREQRILSAQEIAALLAAADGDAFDLIAIHLYTGMRQGEILGLTWKQVDFDAGVIHVREQLQRPRDGQPARLAPLKTSESRRDVTMLPQLSSLLAKRKLASVFSGDDDFIFAAGPSEAIHYSRANRLLHSAAEAAGIDRFKSHDFRHTYASHLIVSLGEDIKTVQKELGHAKASITSDVYAHLFDQARHRDELRDRLAVSEYASLLGPKPLST